MYLLCNRNTGSSAESGNAFWYYLPNSFIHISLASMVGFNGEDYEEGIGFCPDYWLDSLEPIEEVINWIKNSDYKFKL